MTEEESNFLKQLNYTFIKNLGEGVFGKVFEVRNSQGENVALKILKVTPRELPLLIKELYAGKILSKLTTYILPIGKILFFDPNMYWEDVPESDIGVGFEMPLMKSDLKNALDSLSLNDFISIVYGISCGLNIIHRLGMLHLDIKPENILLDSKNNPYIADFGFAEMLNSRYVRAPKYLATKTYRSPQIICNIDESANSPSTDMWSLGILILEALAVFIRREQKQTSKRELWQGPVFTDFAEEKEDLACLLRVKGYHTPEIKSSECHNVSLSWKKSKEARTTPYIQSLFEECIKPKHPEKIDERKQGIDDAVLLLEALLWTSPSQKQIAKTSILFEIVSGLLRVNPLERWSAKKVMEVLEKNYSQLLSKQSKQCRILTLPKQEEFKSFNFNPALYLSKEEMQDVDGSLGDILVDRRYKEIISESDKKKWQTMIHQLEQTTDIDQKRYLDFSSMKDKQGQLGEIIMIYEDLISKLQLQDKKTQMGALLVAIMSRWGPGAGELLMQQIEKLGFKDMKEANKYIEFVLTSLYT